MLTSTKMRATRYTIWISTVYNKPNKGRPLEKVDVTSETTGNSKNPGTAANIPVYQYIFDLLGYYIDNDYAGLQRVQELLVAKSAYKTSQIAQGNRLMLQWSQQQSMSILLIQGCSKSKNCVNGTVSALDLYSGFFFKIIKKAMRENEFDDRIDIWILSAEYGLIEEGTEIRPYDRRIDDERAAELAPSVSETFQSKEGSEYDIIIVNVGNDYRDALPDLGSLEHTRVHHIDGDGIGVKGHKLKQIVRGDFSDIRSEPIERKVV
jgi:hypothetical protein